MAYQEIHNGESGLAVRQKLNSMFYELYQKFAEELWFAWKNTIDEIRAIENPKHGQQKGLYPLNAVYEFDENSTAQDDGLNVLKPNNLADTQPGRWLLKRMFADRDKIQNLDGTSYVSVSDSDIDLKINSQVIFLRQDEKHILEILSNGNINFRNPESNYSKLTIQGGKIKFEGVGAVDNYVQSYHQQLGGTCYFRLPVSNGQIYFELFTPTSNDTTLLLLRNKNSKARISPKAIYFEETYTKFGIHKNLSSSQRPVLFIGGDSESKITEGTKIIIKGGDFNYDTNNPWQHGGDILIDAGKNPYGNTHGNIYLGYAKNGNVRIGNEETPEEKLDIIGTTKTQGRRIEFLWLEGETEITLDKTHYLVIGNILNGNITIHLPDVSQGNWNGQVYKFINVYYSVFNSYKMQVVNSAGDTYNLIYGYEYTFIYESNNNGWFIKRVSINTDTFQS